MLSVVSEAALEGMRFSTICAPSRFHTAKTYLGHWPDQNLKASIAPFLTRRTIQSATL
jgi:hypothetical protein